MHGAVVKNFGDNRKGKKEKKTLQVDGINGLLKKEYGGGG